MCMYAAAEKRIPIGSVTTPIANPRLPCRAGRPGEEPDEERSPSDYDEFVLREHAGFGHAHETVTVISWSTISASASRFDSGGG